MPPALKQLKDIPSIAYLYRTKQLKPSSNTDLPKGNQDLNDKICTIQYDLTKLQVDAIVNAANKRLAGGGGVDGAIHTVAGPDLLKECLKLGGCETGSAKITDAYNLPCKKVIHAVGPIFHNEQTSEPELRGCYKTALQLAIENDCRSVAFSAISTGIYGYPSKKAAKAALREVVTFLRKPEGKKLDKVIFCSFLDKDVDAYAQEIPEVFPPTDEDLSESVPPILETKSSMEIVQEDDERTRGQDIQTSIRTRSSLESKAGNQTSQEDERESRNSNSKSRVDDCDGVEKPKAIEDIPDIEDQEEGRQNNQTNVDLVQSGDNSSIVDTTIGSRQPDASHDESLSVPDSVSSTESGDSGVGDLTRSNRSIKSADAGGENRGWKGLNARSRAVPATNLNTDYNESVTNLQSASKCLEMNGCVHNWKMDDGRNGLRLWPRGRHRCADCGAVMDYRNSTQTVNRRSSGGSYFS